MRYRLLTIQMETIITIPKTTPPLQFLSCRLNRALEEVEKYKTALQKTKSQSKVSTDTALLIFPLYKGFVPDQAINLV